MNVTAPTDPPLSIAFVIARYPPALGGTEDQADSLARHLRKAGHNVTVYTQKLRGIKVRKVPGVVRMSPPVGGRIASFFFGIGLVIRLLIRRPELIQAFLLSSPTIFAALAARIIRRPVVAKLGGGGGFGDLDFSGRTRLGRFRLRLITGMVDHFIVTSTEAASWLFSKGVSSERCSIIPNGVDRSLFRRLPTEAGSRPDRTVIFSGRLEEEKDPVTLLRAWADVSSSEDNSHLVLIGDGSLRAHLEELARSLKIDRSISFAGHVPHNSMLYCYTRGSIFALPSLSEGLSNSLLEAMACGLSPVVSDIPGNRSVFPGGEGALFFPPGDSKKLADCLIALLTDKDLREKLSEGAVKISLEYGMEKNADVHMNLYYQMIREKAMSSRSSIGGGKF